MARMTRVSPPELERGLPGPHASMRSTCAPRLARCSAVQPPKAPLPITTTRGFDLPESDCASRRPIDDANGTAATHSRNVRRETPLSEMSVSLEIHSCADADRAGLVDQVA